MTILDTSAIIEILKGTKKGKQIKEIIKENNISTTSINIHESLIILRENEREKFSEICENIKIYPFEKKSAKQSARIERTLKDTGEMIQRVDTFIAGICLSQNQNLITLDKDFKRIPGLKVTVV